MRIFAHRYKYRHDRRREVLRKALKRGAVKLIQETEEGWLYEIAPELKKELRL
jgi:citrate synthase